MLPSVPEHEVGFVVDSTVNVGVGGFDTVIDVAVDPVQLLVLVIEKLL